jgi:exodeoxyribonuclease VII large subunit
VFFTLKDKDGSACVEAALPRRRFDALSLALTNGERVHVYGRPEVWPQKGELRLQVLSIERFGLGAHLAALERLKQKLAAEGLFAAERKRPLPRLPRRIGLVTGNDAAAKRDVIASVTSRFPPAQLLVAETRVQGHRAAVDIAAALHAVATQPSVDVIVLARGGGSFEDLLPFSDERLVRAVVDCPVPVVSAVGHEQDTPLCDLAADARASTPTAAARLVVPDLADLTATLERRREALRRSGRAALDRQRDRLELDTDRLRRSGRLLLERRRNALEHCAGRLRTLSPRATLTRGYAIVRLSDAVVRSATALAIDDRVDVELAEGRFAGRVENVEP